MTYRMLKTIRAEYAPGYGWQYIIRIGGQDMHRAGNYQTESEALQAGNIRAMGREEPYSPTR